jgi:hypothetical protein
MVRGENTKKHGCPRGRRNQIREQSIFSWASQYIIVPGCTYEKIRGGA